MWARVCLGIFYIRCSVSRQSLHQSFPINHITLKFPRQQPKHTNTHTLFNQLFSFTMDSVKQGANYVAEKAKEATSGASKETNKQVAKDSDAGIGTR